MSMRGIISRMTRRPSEDESGGKLYGLFLLILPIIMGFSLGRLADLGLGYVLDEFSGNNGESNSAVTGTHRESSRFKHILNFRATFVSTESQGHEGLQQGRQSVFT